MDRREDKHNYIRKWVDMGNEMKYEKNIHCKRLLQMLQVEVAVILQYYCESAVTCCEPYGNI